MECSSTRIVIGDDNQTLLQQFCELGKSLGAAIEGCSDFVRLLRRLSREEPVDCVIMDVRLPFARRFDSIEDIRLVNNSVPVLFMTNKVITSGQGERLPQDVSGLFYKEFGLEGILESAIKLSRNSQRPGLSVTEKLEFGGRLELSALQCIIGRAIIAGMDTHEIAGELRLPASAVRTQVRALKRRLGASRRIDLIAKLAQVLLT